MPVYIEKSKSDKLNQPYSIYVWTDSSDPVFIEKMKTFPVKYYNTLSKRWEVPLDSLSLLFSNFKNIIPKWGFPELTEFRHKSLEEYEKYLSDLKPEVDFEFKTKPDPHQIEFFNYMLHHDKVILGDPMGLGKTKEYLDVCEYRKKYKGYKKILFIAKAKHKDNMAKEIELHTNSKYIIVEGNLEKRLELMRKFYWDPDIYYLLIGYEIACIHSKELKLLGKNMGFDGVILDEFNKIKNWGGRSKKGKVHITIQIVNLIEYLNPELLIEASGTPMTKDSTDLYAPLRLTGIEKRSYSQFKQEFCVLDHWGNIKRSKNEPLLSEKLHSVMVRRPKALLKLPEPRVTYIPVELPPDQRALYRAAVEGIKSELRGTKVYGASQLALLTRLRQITTNPKLVDSNAPSIKEEVLLDLLDQMDPEEKAVIYSIYTEEAKNLYNLLKSYNPVYVDGSTKKPLAQVDLFQADPSRRVMTASLHAMKESFTLTAANNCFFIDYSWTVTDNQQARDRLYRRGQNEVVNVYVIYCKNTIDERVLDVLSEDSSSIYEVVGDVSTSKVVTKDIIEYLLS